MSQDREYDLVLFGATGFTGSIAAIYVTENAPTNLRWAIAGRSEQKLKKLKDELDSQNSNRSGVGSSHILTSNILNCEMWLIEYR